MKYFEWNFAKNEWLKQERGISFEDFLEAFGRYQVLDIIPHPNKRQYKNQKIFIVEINNYVYAVPFVEDEQKVFLKTIIPSRKLTKKYLKK